MWWTSKVFYNFTIGRLCFLSGTFTATDVHRNRIHILVEVAWNRGLGMYDLVSDRCYGAIGLHQPYGRWQHWSRTLPYFPLV